MKEFLEAVRTVEGLPVMTLGALVVLGAFGLAAFAIYAVLTVSKRRR